MSSEYEGEERRQVKCALHDDMLKRMSKQVSDLHKVITGNGDPTTGILFKVAENTIFRKKVDKVIWTLAILVMTSLVPQVVSIAKMFLEVQ